MCLIETDIELDCRGEVYLGTPDKYDHFHGNWLPGDLPDVLNFRVFIGKLDITSQLSPEKINELKNRMILDREEELEAS